MLLDFYPVTALMLVVLAILNDLPIMMIAFDNAPVAAKPVRWQMNRILTLASILGVLGVVSSFILLWVAREYFHLDAGVIQTLVFLKLAVAGHLTIYLARTGQQHFWERPLPALSLWHRRNNPAGRNTYRDIWRLRYDTYRVAACSYRLGLCIGVVCD